MELKHELKAYGAMVARHWLVIAVPILLSFFGATQDIIQSIWKDFVMPVWVWFAIIFTGFGIAQFLAFRDMRKERDAERAEKEKLRKYDVAQDALNQLAEFRTELIAYQNTEIADETRLGVWMEQYKSLREQIVAHIRQRINPSEAETFENIGIFSLVRLESPPGLNETHHNCRSRVIRDHQGLTSLILAYSRKQPSQEEAPLDAAGAD